MTRKSIILAGVALGLLSISLLYIMRINSEVERKEITKEEEATDYKVAAPIVSDRDRPTNDEKTHTKDDTNSRIGKSYTTESTHRGSKQSSQSSSVNTSESEFYQKLWVVLQESLIDANLDTSIGNCIKSLVQSNLKAENPLTFDGIADKCSKEASLEADDQQKVRDIFKKSIKLSQKDIVLDDWYNCALNRRISTASSCVNDMYKEAITKFYNDNLGRSLMTGTEFIKAWSPFINETMDRMIKSCKDSLPESLTEVYANECIGP